jgi:hypothetical protein
MRTEHDRHWPELPPKGRYARLTDRLSTPRTQRLLRVTGRLLILAIALILVLALALFVSRTYSLDSATYPGTVQRLDVDAGTGEAAVVGSDRRDIFVMWQRRYSLIKPQIQRQMRGGTLQLRSRCPRTSLRCAVILGSQVPERIAVSIRTRSAPATAQNLRGPLDITTLSGDVTAQHIAAPVRVDTSTGKMILDDLQGDLVAKTVSAPIQLHDIRGQIRLISESGSITGAGWVTRALDAQTATGWVTAEFGTPPGRIDIRSVSGQVTLSVPAGHYRLELEAPAGQITVNGIVDDPTSTRTIKISTGGGIVLTGR